MRLDSILPFSTRSYGPPRKDDKSKTPILGSLEVPLDAIQPAPQPPDEPPNERPQGGGLNIIV